MRPVTLLLTLTTLMAACGGDVVDFPNGSGGSDPTGGAGGDGPGTTAGNGGGGPTSTGSASTTGAGDGWWGGDDDCGGFQSGEATCDACIADQCCLEAEACGGDMVCAALTNCLSQCDGNAVLNNPGGDPCASGCFQMFAKGDTLPAFDLVNCMALDCNGSGDACFQ